MRTTSSWWLLSMAEVFRRQQMPVRQLFKVAGISMRSLANPDSRYPQDGVTRLWESAESHTGNDHIGLDVGRQVSISGFPVLGYSLITASGLGDGFQRFLRYQRMVGESANIQLEMNQGQLELRFDFAGDELPVSCHSIDAAMAALVAMARLIEGDDWQPLGLLVSRNAPVNAYIFEDYYQCPVSFGAEKNVIQLDAVQLASQLQQSTLGGDPSLDLAVNQGKPLVELVEMLIQPKLQDGNISKSQVAEWLNMTPRTLQRRLAKEGESFQQIYDRVRYQRAMEYLANPQITQIEVAFLCGFSDITAFHHAFKRWHGKTPGEFRESAH